MVLTDIGRDFIAKAIGGSGASIGSVAVGTGSAAVNISRSGLITESIRNPFSTIDYSVDKEVIFTGEFNSLELSGLSITEFGSAHLSSGGQLWNVEGFPGINFTGNNELQVEVTFQIY